MSGDPRGGSHGGPRGGSRGGPRSGVRARVRRPRVARHAVRRGELAAASVTLPPAGLVLGAGEDGALVVRLFRSEPLRVGVVSAGQLAQLIAYRAVAVGAHVTVVTDDPQAWGRLVGAVPRGPAWLTVLPGGARVNAIGSVVRPSLVVDATQDQRALPRWEQGRWQTFMSVLPELPGLEASGAELAGGESAARETAGTRETAVIREAAGALRSYDLLITQRLEDRAADAVRLAFGLSWDRAVWFAQMPPGVVAVAATGQLAFGQLGLSDAERRLYAAR